MRLPKLNISKLSSGFTLVELIVVIGVLGILATGLLATIDPLEQFRKGQDSNRKSSAIELSNALTRYYATHSLFPWGVSASSCSASPTSTKVDSLTATCLQVLVGEGELKSTFKDSAVLKDLFITDLTVGQEAKVAVCFDPASKSESSRAETKYTYAASTGGAGTTYFCTQ